MFLKKNGDDFNLEKIYPNSVCQNCFSFGLGHEVFFKLHKAIRFDKVSVIYDE